MKWLISSTVLLLLLFLSANAQEDGAGWLKRIDDAERVQHMVGEVDQIISTSSGAKRTLSLKSWSAENGDISLMAYTAPPRVKGDKILMREGGDVIWYYMKRRDVTRQFAGHTRKQKVMGSDFSYEDMSQGNMTEDYSAELIGFEDIESISCVKLHLTPTESGPSYDHLLIWACRENALSRIIEYYDSDGLMKTLVLSDIREIEGRKIAFKFVMLNNREGSETAMQYQTVTFASEPEGWIFTKEALDRDVK